MNRRQFVNGMGITAIAVGISGCTSDSKDSDQLASKAAVSGPCVTTVPPTPAEVKYRSTMLMLFMLGVSQRTSSCKPLMEDFFPDNNTPTVDAGRVRSWGFDQSDIDNFIRDVKTTGLSPKQIRDRFAQVHQLFSAVISYTGPECPGPTSLNNIIVKAKAQTQP